MTKKHINNHAWVATDLSSPTFDMFIWGYKENQYDTSQPHSHDYHEILIFEQGGGIHEIDNVSFPINDFSVHFVPKHSAHHVKRDVKTSGFTLLLNEAYFDTCPIKKQAMETFSFFKPLSGGHILNVGLDKYAKINALISEIKEEYFSKDKEKARMEVIQTMVHLFLLECHKKMKELGVLNIQTIENLYSPTIVKLLDLIENQYKKHLPVTQYAKLLYISVSQLNRTTKSVFQKTVIDLINDRILKESKNLLKYTKAPVKEIAWELGFEHSSNFIEFFNRKVGVSPTKYRETTA